MKKIFLILVFVVLAISPVFSQTKKSANSNTVLPPKTKLYPGLALDNRPPSSTMTRSADVKIPNTSAPATTPIRTPSPALATGYQVKEGGYKSYLLSGTSGVLASIAIFFGLLLVSVIYIIKNRKKSKSSRMKVREYKEKRFASFGKKEGTVIFDHDSNFH